jgi:hypothetical protein
MKNKKERKKEKMEYWEGVHNIMRDLNKEK